MADQPIDVLRTDRLLELIFRIAFTNARVDWAIAHEKPLVFQSRTGEYSLAFLNDSDWSPAVVDPEILTLWGGEGSSRDGLDRADLISRIPVLVPGRGWTEPPPRPDGYGSRDQLGWDTKPIVRWNVVPFQDIKLPFQLGVVAFHINGIERVTFSVDNGPWKTVYLAGYNPRTQTEEFSVMLEPLLFEANGMVEVRAIVYPRGAGIPRVLAGPVQYSGTTSGWYSPELNEFGEPTNSLWIGEHSLELFVHAGAPLPEQVVELDAGAYTWGQPPLATPMLQADEGGGLVEPDPNRWVVFKAKSGLDRSEVIIRDAVSIRFGETNLTGRGR